MPKTDDATIGYVYILTNPSFREDWIKIGKSSRPVNVRSKELDNTAVPLPFEIYATIKTASFNKVESMLHKILEGAHVRIRSNREFFNVKPEDALRAFYDIAELLPDAEVYLGGKEAPKSTSKVSSVTPKAPKKSTPPRSMPSKAVEVHADDELPKGARFSFDGTTFYSMATFAFAFIKQLLNDDSSITFPQLEANFPKSILTGYRYCGVVATKDTIDKSSHSLKDKIKAYRIDNPDFILSTPADGIDFCVSTQWTRDSLKNLIPVIERLGYPVFMETK